MKKTIFTVLMIVLSLSMTSCWEFNRQQMMKNAAAEGKAVLLEAESSKQALIEQAKAEAQAEIERAKGVARANEIIGKSMNGNDEYLQYLKIQAIRETDAGKIYIPTEAGVPILEAK